MAPVIKYVNSKGFKFGIVFSYTFKYTDAGLYTCNQGERDHKIPGSYGKLALEWSTGYIIYTLIRTLSTRC